MKLLLALFEQGTTGVLYLKREDVLKVLYLSRGKLIWAISNSDEDKLENILLSKNLVDPAVIKKVKRASRVSDSIGKLLVEKGLITLEELIDSSKQQLRRIILSILKWTDGSFQYVEGAPPERLLSLDLNITDFIIDYIVEEVDFHAVWKEIGSLQIEFIKNPDDTKLVKYLLSDKQRELLNSFDGENKLESILSRHYGGHRQSMLKIIYFFLMSELLIKKEFELSDVSEFDEDKGLIDFDSRASIRRETTGSFKKMEPLKAIDKDEDHSYVFKKASETGSSELEGEDKGEPAGGPDSNDRLIIAPIQITGGVDMPGVSGMETGTPEESNRIKLLYIIFIFVFFILVIGGIILLLLPWMRNGSPSGNIVKEVDRSYIVSTTKERSGDQVKRPGVGDAGKPESSPPVEEENGIPPGRTGLVGSETAIKYFRAGDLLNAGAEWKRELEKAGVEFSILLELDCLEESVMQAYNKIEMKKEFFLLNRQVGGKTCFLVMWGQFYTRREAAAAMKLIPNYFWKQRDPPEIVKLSTYF